MFATARKIQRRRELNGEHGFTLIELLIVIVVLGILAAIVVFALGGVTSSSAQAACNTDAKTVSVAVSAYLAQNPGGTPTGGATGNLVPTYLKAWPSNSYYTISIDSAVPASTYVQVALITNDPGATAPYATTPGTTAEAYEAGQTLTAGAATAVTPFAFGAGTLNAKGICSGA